MAAVALVVTVLVARGDLRASRAAAEQPGPMRPPDPPGTGDPPAQPGAGAPAHPAPGLSADGRAELARIVSVLERAGIVAPDAIDRDRTADGLADFGAAMTAFDVLSAAHEAGFTRAGPVFHATQVEQDSAYLGEQVADLDRLVGDDLAVTEDGIDVVWHDGERAAPTRVRLRLDGTRRTLDYRGDPKHLSTVLHGTVATALRDKGSAIRLAWLWSDSGAWVVALPAALDLDRLNDDLHAPEYERWEWIDEQEPYAAGDLPGMTL